LKLDVGGSVNEKDGHGFTHLHYCVMLGDERGVELLLSLGADVNILSGFDNNCLQPSCGDMEQTEVQMKDKKDDIRIGVNNSIGYSALHLACRTYRPDIVSLLINAEGVDGNLLSRSNAKSSQSPKFATSVESKGSEDSGVGALHIACKYHFFEAVEILARSRKVDINLQCGKMGLSALHVIAINAGPWGTSKNKRDDFDLSDMIGSSIEHMRFLRAKGAKSDLQDVNGATALHLAAKVGAVGVMEVLMSDGKADVNAQDKNLCTPLHYACRSGILVSCSSSPVSLLLKKGADITRKNSNGETALDTLESLKVKRVWSDSCDLAIKIAERQLMHQMQAEKNANQLLEQEEALRK